MGADFAIAYSDQAILGFSYGGTYVSAGSGVLVYIEGDVTAECIEDVIISGSNGVELTNAIETADGIVVYSTLDLCQASSSCTEESSEQCLPNADGYLCPPDGPEDDDSVVLTLSGNALMFTSTEDIYGFQIDHSACIDSAFGGASEDADFAIAYSDQAILGFSYGGTYVSAGSGVLVYIEGDVTAECIEDVIISGSNGVELTNAIETADGIVVYSTLDLCQA